MNELVKYAGLVALAIAVYELVTVGMRLNIPAGTGNAVTTK